MRIPCWLILSVALSALAGCSGADEPKMAEHPAPTPPVKSEPQKIGDRKTRFGDLPKYRRAMEGVNQAR
jgi:hypothetical protein